MHNPFRYLALSSKPDSLRNLGKLSMAILRNLNGLDSWRNAKISLQSVNSTKPFGPLFAAEIRKRRVHPHCYSNWCWLSLLLNPSGAETPVFWTPQRLASLVAPLRRVHLPSAMASTPSGTPPGGALPFPHPSRRAHMNDMSDVSARSRARDPTGSPMTSRFIRSPRSPTPDAPPFTWTSRLSGERSSPSIG